jgi:tetratricopeptide (TPR) repeat protein
MKFAVSLSIFALCLSGFCLAADDEHHHFDPNEKLGTVSFPTSCSSAVQKSFERGVALLHSFGYEEAEHQFAEVAQQDPQCAITYWGQAMSLYHQLWSRPPKEDLNRGWELIQKGQQVKAKTQRERDYIDALAAFYRNPATDHEQRAIAYASAMEGVYKKYPADREAAVFYALSLLASGRNGTEVENEKKAIAILQKLFAQEPEHPGVAHYLIHATDNPQFAQEGLAAARRYAGIAPSSAHALHMPSHIFARLGLWQDDIQSNLAALAAAQQQATTMHLHMMHHRIHSLDFLEYAYLQVGDDASAKGIIDQVMNIKPEDVEPEFKHYLNEERALFPANYALETRQWKDALAFQPPAGIEPYTAADTYWAQAVAAGHLHDAASARKAVEQFDAMVEATKKSDKPYIAQEMTTDRDEAHAWLAFAENKNDEALNLLRGVAKKQDEVGKREVEIPAREMLADMLLDMGRLQDALVEYEKSLHTDPNRFNGLYGAAQAAQLAHEPQKSAKYYLQLLKNCDNGAHSDRPELARAKEQLNSGN